jgi:hypothetical protein
MRKRNAEITKIVPGQPYRGWKVVVYLIKNQVQITFIIWTNPYNMQKMHVIRTCPSNHSYVAQAARSVCVTCGIG